MAIAALMIITHKAEFSNQIIEYFKSLNPINNFNFSFLPVGLDNRDEEVIINQVLEQIAEDPRLTIVVIFADLGLPTKLAYRIRDKKHDVQVFLAKGSIIENAYLAYLMLNTKAPIEAVLEILDKDIRNT